MKHLCAIRRLRSTDYNAPGVVRRTSILVALVAILVVLTSSPTYAEQDAKTDPAPANQISSFKVGESNPTGLAFDGKHIWTADSDAAALIQRNAADAAVIRTIKLDKITPTELAWDGGNLWCLDASARKIHKLDADGQILATIDAPVVELRGGQPMQVTGLAWDGQYLWSGCIAGWSSRMFQIDAATGEVKRWIFSRSVPQHIASDGKSLFSSADAGVETSPGVVFEYDLETGRCISHAKVAPAKTAGLAHDGDKLWRLDLNQKTASRLVLE